MKKNKKAKTLPKREKETPTEKTIGEDLTSRGFKQLFDETVADLEKQGETVLSGHLKKHFHFDLQKGTLHYDGKGFTKVSETEEGITYTFEP